MDERADGRAHPRVRSERRPRSIEPNEVIDPIDIPPHVVLCFFQDVIERVVAEHGGRQIDVLVSEIGQNPVYELTYAGERLTVAHPGVGAPLAAAFTEELIARGCTAFVACGRRRRAGARARVRARDRADRGRA